MADLIGTASIRVDMNTTAAGQAVRRFANQAEAPLRRLQRSVSAVRNELQQLRSIRVTIDDQTRTGATAVRSTVTQLQGLGPVRIPVQINDGTRRGARTVQATVASLQRLGPIQINARVDADATDITATAAALSGLQAAARGAARALGTLATRATAASAALVALGAAARTLRGDMDDLDGSIRRTGDGMTGLRGRLGTVTASAGSARSALSKLKTAALLVAPALIPIAAQAIHILPLAANFGAAAVAVGVFGAAVAGQVVAISDVAEAEKKATEAVKTHGASSAEAAKAQDAYRSALSALPPATRAAAAGFSVLSDQYREWSKALAADTMPVVTKSFAVFGALFPKMTPLVQGTSAQLDRFMTIAAGGVQSPGFDRFMKSFADFSTGVLTRANDALIRFTRTLDTGKISGGVAEFMEYARENGPLVRDTLSNLAEALGNVLEGAADVGPGLLTVVNALAGIAAAVPPGVITTMLQLAIALKAVRLAAAGAAAAAAGTAAFTAAITAMRTAAAGATGVLPRLGAAFMALSRTVRLAVAGTGIGLLLIALSELSQVGRSTPPDVDKLTKSLERLGHTGKATGEAAKAFGANFQELRSQIDRVIDPSVVESIDNWGADITGGFLAAGDDTEKFTKSIGAIDESLASLVAGGKAGEAAAAIRVITKGMNAEQLKKFKDGLVEHKDAVANLKFEQQLAAEAMGLFGQQAQQTSAKLAEQKMSADGLRQAITALNDVNRAGLGGMIAFEASIDAAAKAARENAGALRMVGGQLDLNSPKAQAAATALNDLASKTDEAAGAAREQGQSWSAVNGIYERGRQQLIQNAIQMGLTRVEAEKLAGQILKTPNKTALLKADITDWKTKISAAEKQLKTAKGDKKAKLTADIADWRAKVARADVQLKGVKATKQAKLTANIADWRAKVANAERQLRNAKGEKKARLTGDISDLKAKIASARARLNSLNGKTATTYVNTVYTSTARGGHPTQRRRGATGGLYTGSGFKHRGYAHGGLVDGPGTEMSDSVFAPWLSRNEFVVNARRTRQYLPLLKAINEGRLGMGVLNMGGTSGGAASLVRAVAEAAVAAVRKQLQPVFAAMAREVGQRVAGGGLIKGRGTDTSDSVPILASNREFMMQAAAVDYYGVPTMAALNSMRIPRSKVPAPAVSSMRTSGRAPATTGGDLHLHVHNTGVIGSQMELDNWLTKSIARLDHTGRLPKALAGR